MSRILYTIGMLLMGTASAFAQTCSANCPSCVTYTLSCQQCGLTVCTGQQDGTNTVSIDNCLTPTPLTCSLHHDDNGNRVICGNQNQQTQCYQRDIKVSGYTCPNGVISTTTGTGCCLG
jgi:hypothetical protein